MIPDVYLFDMYYRRASALRTTSTSSIFDRVQFVVKSFATPRPSYTRRERSIVTRPVREKLTVANVFRVRVSHFRESFENSLIIVYYRLLARGKSQHRRDTPGLFYYQTNDSAALLDPEQERNEPRNCVAAW